LQEAEDSVGRAAHNTLGGSADTPTLERMKAAMKKSRLKETEKIFGTRLPSQNAE